MDASTIRITYETIDGIIKENEDKNDPITKGYVLGLSHAGRIFTQVVEHEERLKALYEQTNSRG